MRKLHTATLNNADSSLGVGRRWPMVLADSIFISMAWDDIPTLRITGAGVRRRIAACIDGPMTDCWLGVFQESVQ